MLPISKKKVVVIGFDGATFSIIRPMIEQGRLKNLANIADSGISGELFSVLPPLSSVAWSSFASGANPAKHGMYDFSKRVEGSYEYAPVTSLDRGAKGIWNYASQAGKRCLIVNVPLTYPPETVNGIMISGFPYPESRRDFAKPKQVIDEIRDKLGITSILKPNPQFLKEGDEIRIATGVNEISRNQTKILKYYMERENWDLVVSVYDAIDVVSHFLFHHVDPNHPKYDARKAKIYGPLLYDVYEQLDQSLGEIRSILSEKDALFVISDHGFGPVYNAVYVNNWLMDNKYLRLKRSFGTRFRKVLFDLGITSESIFNTAKKLRIVDTRTNTYNKSSKKVALAKKLTLSTDDIDWRDTRAYAAGNYGPIFINLKGREPQGRVGRGKEYDTLVLEILERLKSIKDPDTGLPIFDLIYTKDRIYSGAFYDSAPDIMYFDSAMLNYPLRVFEFGSRKLVAPNPIYTGAHRMEGILLGSGPDFAHKSNFNRYLIDIAPTVMYMLGLDVPSFMDGKVLTDAFQPNSEYASLQIKYDEGRSRSIVEIAEKIVRSGKLRI